MGSTRKMTLVMLHGFMGCGGDWEPIARALGPSYGCLYPDLPGHGALQNDPETAHASMEKTANRVLGELEKQGVGVCALAGYSMGGRVALYLAVRHPDRFAGLVLESASPGIADASARCERIRQDTELARKLAQFTGAAAGSSERTMDHGGTPSPQEMDFHLFLEQWYGQPLFCTLADRPELLRQLIERRRRNTPQLLAASLLGLGTGTQPSLWECLPSLQMPVLLVTGAQDTKFTAIAEAMMACLPRARHEVFQGCSHCPHEEAPARFVEVLEKFLRKTVLRT